MIGDNDLISIRSRGKFTRPFEYVQNLQKEAQKKYKDKEEQLTRELDEVRKAINNLQSHQVQGSKVILSKEQVNEIQRFRDKERQIKKQRREIRKNLREDIEALGQRLTFLNVFLIPLLVGVFGAWRVFSLSRRGGN